jgi:hypothetical protein
MYQKLREADRRRIHAMLDDGMTHAEIARAMRVCVKTIDREAARWRARTVTVRAEAVDGGRPIVSSMTVGSEVRAESLAGIIEEALRVAAELEAMSFEVPLDELEEAIEEAEQAARKLDAEIAGGPENVLRGCPRFDDGGRGGVPIPPRPLARLRPS